MLSRTAHDEAAVAPPVPPGRPATELLKACHPLPAAAVTVLAAALAAVTGRGFPGGLAVVAAVAAGQLSVGWCNDRVDLGRDRTVGRQDKPLVRGLVPPRTVAVAAGASLAVCVPLSLACGLLAGCVHLVCVAAAWWYNLQLKRTVFSWVPYAVAFGLLPAVVTLGLPGAPWPPAWLMAAAALLGTGAHFANVMPDIEHDLVTGVNGLPQRLGRGRSGLMAALLVLSSSFVLLLAPPGAVSPAGWVIASSTVLLCSVAVASPGAARGRLPFLATVVIAGADVVQLLLRSAQFG
ncbi:UbiA family prenyltransferase [Streptomyces sp. NPDC057445]|uniref:UbiA family prenyltransferase n=1 Tax=Streptomyces sp. NPDC057445 TaxID=3346136 RepID=UPI003680D46B